jgi:hypothetical protein
MAVLDTNSTNDPCQLWDNLATNLRSALKNVEIPSQGNLKLTRIDNSTFNNTIPYFSDFVISGLLASQGSNNLDVDITPGDYQIDANFLQIGSSQTVTINSNTSGNTRIDAIVVDTNNNVSVVTGSPAVDPVRPSIASNQLRIADIRVPDNTTSNSGNLGITTYQQFQQTLIAGDSDGDLLVWNDAVGEWRPESLSSVQQSTVKPGTQPSTILTWDAVNNEWTEYIPTDYQTEFKPDQITLGWFTSSNDINTVLLSRNGEYLHNSVREAIDFDNDGNVAFIEYLGRINPDNNVTEGKLERVRLKETSTKGLAETRLTTRNFLDTQPDLSLSYFELDLADPEETPLILNRAKNFYYHLTSGEFAIWYNDNGTKEDYLRVNNNDETVTVHKQLNSESGRVKNTNVVDGNYTAQATDHIIAIDTSSNAVTVTLPSSPTDGREYIIKDFLGNANNNNITINGNGNDIDGSSTQTLTNSYSSITVVFVDDPYNPKWIVHH